MFIGIILGRSVDLKGHECVLYFTGFGNEELVSVSGQKRRVGSRGSIFFVTSLLRCCNTKRIGGRYPGLCLFVCCWFFLWKFKLFRHVVTFHDVRSVHGTLLGLGKKRLVQPGLLNLIYQIMKTSKEMSEV